MTSATEADLQALKAEIKQLRADFGNVAVLLKDTARHGSAEAGEKVRATAERAWHEVGNKAAGLTQKIEEQPVNSALAALGIGVLLGFLLTGRRS